MNNTLDKQKIITIDLSQHKVYSNFEIWIQIILSYLGQSASTIFIGQGHELVTLTATSFASMAY